MQQRLLKQGEQWRIGWNPNTDVYKGLVGTKDWAIELTEVEFLDFCRLFSQLAQTMEYMSQELMDQEKIACEAESQLIWLEVEGFPYAYSLRLLLNEGRRCEGYWSEEATKELLQAVQTIFVF
ncbi:DUF1818 domain-containing protein [Aphanothece hegewaldii CCALA 016]|uniref:DUF1818 domain-containing protein n=1 Tax=Aphanothece hegewaldii CCALA 016 TaxID=2107694 RepID=A0A2T1LVF9_9CHRO|nr:DUF1818 family protein [Aphanothece hegewaldii]PSF35710.1 DUF1818 domain-containing protein [Aphanothece hegewaldii CCALA 016]